MKFPFRKIAAGSIAAVGLASVVIHPFGNVKGLDSSTPLLAGSSADFAVLQIVDRSCQSCHSEKTRWPWYSYIAPASWMIENDVRDGRSHMNFSRWSDYPVEEKRQLLAAIASAVRNRVMPLPRYVYLHPDARLSANEINRLYQWTKSERRRLSVSETPGGEIPTGGGN